MPYVRYIKPFVDVSKRFYSMGDSVFGRVSVAVVTPFMDPALNAEQPIDEVGFADIIQHTSKHLASVSKQFGLVGGVIVSGTTGEQHTLTVEEKIRLYSKAIEIAHPLNVPVIAGIAATTTAAVQKLTRSAVSLGVKGIMLGLPPYVRLDDAEIRSYIMSVKSLVPSDEFPILLYNNSFRNGYSPSNELLVDLFRSKVIWGIKHAPQPEEFKPKANALLAMEPSIRLYTGSDKLSIEILNHGHMPSADCPRFYGLTSIIGNLYPQQIAMMLSHLTQSPPAAEAQGTTSSSGSSASGGNTAQGEAIYDSMKGAIDAMLVGTSIPVGLKYALRQSGLGGGFARLPVGNISTQKMADIDKALADVGKV